MKTKTKFSAVRYKIRFYVSSTCEREVWCVAGYVGDRPSTVHLLNLHHEGLEEAAVEAWLALQVDHREALV